VPEPTVSSQDLVEEPRCLQHPAQVQLVGTDIPTVQFIHLPILLSKRWSSEPTTARPSQEVPQQRWFWPKVFKLLRRRTEALLVLGASSTSSGVLVLLFDVFQGVKVQPALLQRSSKKLNSAWQLPHTREQRCGKRYGTNKKRCPFQNRIEETANDEAVPGSGSARV